MTITAFNKVNLKILRGDIAAALKAVGDAHGVDLGIGNISFTSGTFTTRLTAGVRNPTAAAAPGTPVVSSTPLPANHKWTVAWSKYHSLDGFKPADLGRPLTAGGKPHRIVGMTRNSPRGTIILQRLDNEKYFIFQAEQVKHLLLKAA